MRDGLATADVRKVRARMGGTVLGLPDVSLRGPKDVQKKKKPTDGFTFRMPDHIRAYLDHARATERRTMTEILIWAVELDRDLGNLLSEHKPRIDALALKMHLDPRADLARVLAGLVINGLDRAEREAAEPEPKRRK
jgi:hypothetical protein